MSEPTKKNQKRRKRRKLRPSVKLDQIIKLLFKVSKKTLVNTINGLFGEKFKPDDINVTVSKTATELVKDSLEVLRADMFLKLEKSDSKRHFHIEYELRPNSKMGIRVFQYGILKALETAQEDAADDIILPRAVVIHFEESESIPDQYKKWVVFPDGNRVEYIVDVVKYWELDATALLSKKLYNLLPLQLFTLRAELDKSSAAGSAQTKEEAIKKAKEAIEKNAELTEQLYQENEIDADDYDRIITGLAELIKHLDERYKLNQKLSGGDEVIKVLNIAKKAEKQVEKRRSKEMAKKMLLKNKPIEEIAEFTDLTEKEIQRIKI